MIKLTLSFFLLITATVAATDLTMQQCVDLAKENSRRLCVAVAHTERAVALKNQVRSGLFPHVDIEGVWDNNNHSLSGDLSQFQDFHSTTAIGLSAQMGLFDFGATWRRLKASRLRIDAEKFQAIYTQLSVEEEVKAVYLNILERHKALSVIHASINRLKSQVTTTCNLSEQGLVKSVDVLAVQVQLAQEEKKHLRIENEMHHLQMTLNRLIGLPLEEMHNLTDITLQPQTYSFCYAHVLEYAQMHRPDLLALRTKLRSLKAEKAAAQWSIAPQIYAFGNGNYAEKRSSASVGLGLKMALYEGGKRSAEVKKIAADIKELEATLQDVEEIAAVEIQDVLARIEETYQSFLIDKQALLLAEENLKHRQELYQEGLVSITDLLVLEEQLTSVKMNYFSNLYKSHSALARLSVLTGGGYSL